METSTDFTENKPFDLALKFVTQTHQSIFVTGRAGTGKTTFLRKVVSQTTKRLAVAAPTGVAAINAGGVTLHSLFWLPFGGYAENHQVTWNHERQLVNNRTTLFGALRLTRQRRKLLQKLELLIIDEISMVRSDTLDAIDTILKSVRKDQRPFGGLQLVMIGDLLQLPPVVKENEWQILKNYYESPYFFDAQVIRENPLVNIEFKKIYRQSDSNFINILNAIRTQAVNEKQLEVLNQKYIPDFTPSETDTYITLTSHNRLAHKINQNALEALTNPLVKLKAAVSKDFPESLFPVEESLNLKEGAQVMFIKNDTGEERRYFNGKIGFVRKIEKSKDTVIVAFPNGDEEVKVKKEIWENTKYKFNEKQQKIDSEVIGTYSQFPLRLAWAITIHKSQGLTFEKAIVDAGSSFASGQVYVALSRLTSLEGLVLTSKIMRNVIYLDQRVTRYLNRQADATYLEKQLIDAQKKHLQETLLHIFNWNDIVEMFTELKANLMQTNISSKGDAVLFLTDQERELKPVVRVGNKFITNLQRLFRQKNERDYTYIARRVKAAADWFIQEAQKIKTGFIQHQKEFEVKKHSKRYIHELKNLIRELEKKENAFVQANQVSINLNKENVEWENVFQKIEKKKSEEEKYLSPTDKKSSKEISLALFQNGESIEKIARERGMVYTTIFNHLLHFLGNGVEVTELIEQNKLDKIMEVISENPDKRLSEWKGLLETSISYDEIRAVAKWMKTSAVS